MTRLASAILISALVLPFASVAQPALNEPNRSPTMPPAAVQPGTVNPANICQDLVAFLERRGEQTPESPITLEQARTHQRGNDLTACREGVRKLREAGITLPPELAAYSSASL